MGIRFTCPSGHKLHVKAFLAGKRGVCPQCGAKFVIPTETTEQEPASQAKQHRGESPPRSSSGFTSTGVATSPDATSQSIIIPVTEGNAKPSPHSSGESSVAPAAPAGSTSDPVSLPPQPSLSAAGDITPVAYVSRRERQRRKRFTLAILLLLAVIALAVVLLLVLQRGATQPTAGATTEQQRTHVQALLS